jgi:two-component system response regulator (stage 0 sporulation protein A)
MNKPYKILVVEDEIAFKEIITDYLNMDHQHFNVRSCSDGLTAINLIEHFYPDVIVTDVILPEMDGFSFLEKLEQLYPNYIPIIIAISSLKDIEIIKKIKERGADYFLAKPFKLYDLGLIIKSQIKKRMRLISSITSK